MRTADEFLTEIVAKEIACPMGVDCKTATSKHPGSNSIATPKDVGGTPVFALHTEKEGLYTCVTYGLLDFYRRWFTYEMASKASLIIGKPAHDFCSLLKEPYTNFVSNAMFEEVKRTRIYLCGSQDELRLKAIQLFKEICWNVVTACYPDAK